MEKLTKKELKEKYKNRVLIGGVYRITCSGNRKHWLRATPDMQGAKNRFSFSMETNSCPEVCMLPAWNEFGSASFAFEPLESIKKKDTQSECQFLEDVTVLLEMWTEKEGEHELRTEH